MHYCHKCDTEQLIHVQKHLQESKGVNCRVMSRTFMQENQVHVLTQYCLNNFSHFTLLGHKNFYLSLDPSIHTLSSPYPKSGRGSHRFRREAQTFLFPATLSSSSETFPGQRGYIIPPVSFGSALEPLPS